MEGTQPPTPAAAISEKRGGGGLASLPGMDDGVATILAPFAPDVREVALAARDLVRSLVPDAVEELDAKDRLLGYSFIPGTYRGLIVAIAPQRSYVNLMFSKGVELLPLDAKGLLQGTGKVARHVRLRSREDLAEPELRRLIAAAAERTERPKPRG
jgi:hypothetical protein